MKIKFFVALAIGIFAFSSWNQKTSAEVVVQTFKQTTDIPASIQTPDKVETSIGTLEFFDGVPSKATAENVYDYLDRMRGVDAFLKGMPGASVRGLIIGLKDAGVNQYNKVGLTKSLLDSKSIFLTANTSTIYITPYLDVKKMDLWLWKLLPVCWALLTMRGFITLLTLDHLVKTKVKAGSI